MDNVWLVQGATGEDGCQQWIVKAYPSRVDAAAHAQHAQFWWMNQMLIHNGLRDADPDQPITSVNPYDKLGRPPDRDGVRYTVTAVPYAEMFKLTF